MNTIGVDGHLGTSPTLRSTTMKLPVCNFRLASKQSSSAESDWFTIVVYGKLAENCHKYLKKGSKCLVWGSVKQKVWEQSGKERTDMEITATDVRFLDNLPPISPPEQVEIEEEPPFAAEEEKVG